MPNAWAASWTLAVPLQAARMRSGLNASCCNSLFGLGIPVGSAYCNPQCGRSSDPSRQVSYPATARRGGDRSGHGRRFADYGGGHPERLDSEASFAALRGVSPVERSSGRRQFRRLNRGGDRQANAALHRIVFTRLRVDPRTQDYYERRIKECKTRREVVRCLKRYAAREVFHLVRQLQSGPRS
ncbi:transposase [Streptomyces mirabilis]